MWCLFICTLKTNNETSQVIDQYQLMTRVSILMLEIFLDIQLKLSFLFTVLKWNVNIYPPSRIKSVIKIPLYFYFTFSFLKK